MRTVGEVSGENLTRAAQDSSTKDDLGQYFTMVDPFTLEGFRQWVSLIPAGAAFIEPFAGANNLVRLMEQHYPGLDWHSYDIEPADEAVVEMDTLASFPSFPGRDTVVVTNPPYMAKNVARRQGKESVALACGPWDNLYKRCLDQCLTHTDWVAAIIPESFITSKQMRERLWGVISLDMPMFVDTEVPVCLALFTPQPQEDFTLWHGSKELGPWSQLVSAVPSQTTNRITFNDRSGPIALLAVDNTSSPSIRFAPGSSVDPSEIKVSSRHRTRISVKDLDEQLIPDVIAAANSILAQVRSDTGDAVLTAFMGLRSDGAYRRRLDFALARAILTAALEQVEQAEQVEQ